MNQPKIIFQGKPYIIVEFDGKSGAIATPEQFQTFECSYAHLFEDGRIMRYGEQIGTYTDIFFTGEEDTTEVESLDDINSPNWRGVW